MTRPTASRRAFDVAAVDPFFATPEPGIKPDPTPFRTVVDRLGHAPTDCVSVSDGYETDVEPASDLGMHTVRVPTDTPDRPAPAADTVCDDLRAVVDRPWVTD